MVSSTILAGKPFDKRDNTRDYQDPPKNHKNPAKTAKRSESKIHPSPHHIHHRHPAAAYDRERRRGIAPGKTLAHDNMNLFLTVFAVRLNHHRVHGGMRISGHLAHKVFTENSELLIVQTLASKLVCFE